MRDSCGLMDWECDLLGHTSWGNLCPTHGDPSRYAREQAERLAAQQREARMQAVLNKYDDTLDYLAKNPHVMVENTYRGMLGEFYREMQAADNG